MADRTFTQYIDDRTSRGSTPDTQLQNYISVYHDYIAFRSASTTSILVVGDFDGTVYKNAKVIIVNSDSRGVFRQEYDSVKVNFTDAYTIRGDEQGIPWIPQYQFENTLTTAFIGFSLLSIIIVKWVVQHFWKLVRRSSI